jgi:GTP-binding protein HflX
VAVVARGEREEDRLDEMKELLKTAGVATSGSMLVPRDEPDPDRYVGTGKLEEIKRALAETDSNLVACDDELSPRQERNLENELGVPVIDRTAVILDIFADHAHTAEGKLQVELAQLDYNLARMRGLWTHLERLGAGIGTRGPGESQIETDRRLARDRIAKLRRRLRKAERGREVRRSRRETSSTPTIALAGYTNAGKSSLMNAITSADVGVGQRLFHTLDPTTRTFSHNGRDFLLTDTVGFIRKLPHQLVEAFKATLEETHRADLICQVVDASESEADMSQAMAAVETVLREIGADSLPRVVAMNKIDLLDQGSREELRRLYPKAVQVSALEGDGLEALKEAQAEVLRESLMEIEVVIPYEEGDRLAEIYRTAGDLEREDLPEGTLVRARINPAEVHRFADLRPHEPSNGKDPTIGVNGSQKASEGRRTGV